MNQTKKHTWDDQRKKVGRPPRYGERMVQKTVRLPPEWIALLVAEYGTFQEAIETLAQNHLKESENENR